MENNGEEDVAVLLMNIEGSSDANLNLENLKIIFTFLNILSSVQVTHL